MTLWEIGNGFMATANPPTYQVSIYGFIIKNTNLPNKIGNVIALIPSLQVIVCPNDRFAFLPYFDTANLIFIFLVVKSCFIAFDLTMIWQSNATKCQIDDKC